MKSSQFALLLLLVVGLAACGGGSATLEGSTWQLNTYLDAAGQLVSALPDAPVTATFEAGRVVGSGGCNQYMGTCSTNGKELTVQMGGATLMACAPETVMAQEQVFFATMGQAATHRVEADQLVVADADGKTILTFSAVKPRPLTGTTWVLSWYNDGKGALVSVLPGSQITAQFGEDGHLAGSAGCNTYKAVYNVRDNQISIGPAGTTRMACADPAGIMEQEAAYVAALSTATHYQILGGELELTDASGKRIAVYTAQ
jgi:heat shock protein HslJ